MRLSFANKNHLQHFTIALLAGLLLPLAFAPFHVPGLGIIALAILFRQLEKSATPMTSFITGLIFGSGCYALGVSWIFVSIHEYGNLNYVLSFILTLIFIVFLSTYTALFAYIYKHAAQNLSPIIKCLVFSALWCITEYIRAHLFGGFPWLMVGVAQLDTPVKYLLPYFGIYMGSFIAVLVACCLYFALRNFKRKRIFWLNLAVLFLISPYLLKYINQNESIKTEAIPVAIVQANLSMKDKWDEAKFYHMLNTYDHMIDLAINKNNIIVLPESAISIPSFYVEDYLKALEDKAKINNKAILLGTLFADETHLGYYNAVLSLGNTEGKYFKKHLVPFGEFIPDLLQKITHWLEVPVTNLLPGKKNQVPIKILDKYSSLLVCYEIGYPELIRHDLTDTKYLITLSDMGWFGDSLAIYQFGQMAQALSLITDRYQIMANNNGLSQIIDNNGNIVKALPKNSQAILEENILPLNTLTLWAKYGDKPVLLIFLLIGVISSIFNYSLKRKYAQNALINK